MARVTKVSLQDMFPNLLGMEDSMGLYPEFRKKVVEALMQDFDCDEINADAVASQYSDTVTESYDQAIDAADCAASIAKQEGWARSRSTLTLDQKQHILDMMKHGAKQVHAHGVSGGDTILVGSSGRETSSIPFPISLEILGGQGSHLVSMNRAAAKDLIRCLLEVL